MKHLLHHFPNYPREEECYIRLAGYREEEEIDELIYRTVGRVPGSEFLFRGNRGQTVRKEAAHRQGKPHQRLLHASPGYRHTGPEAEGTGSQEKLKPPRPLNNSRLRIFPCYAIRSAMSLPRLSMLLFASAALCSCVGTSPEQEEPKVKKSLSEYMQDNKTNSIANVPTGLLSTTPNQQQATHLTATTQEEMTRADSGAVYYTDAHDPDAPIPGLEEAFAQRKENERWIQSYPTALREAQSTGKPILIWFHHSVGSPPSKKLGAELLHTKEFEDWAKRNVVRVCYDQAEKFESEPVYRKRQKMLEYVKKAPSLFGVRGTPVLLVMSPDGSKVDTLRGYYTGQNAHYFDQIKNRVKLAKQQYEEFKKTLIPKGYRVWTGVNGNTVFAKLSRYSEKTQTLWLQELDGHQSRTSLKRLSLEDRTWLLEQKESHENNGRNKRSGPRGA